MKSHWMNRHEARIESGSHWVNETFAELAGHLKHTQRQQGTSIHKTGHRRKEDE
jgi:hypothetical protein